MSLRTRPACPRQAPGIFQAIGGAARDQSFIPRRQLFAGIEQNSMPFDGSMRPR